MKLRIDQRQLADAARRAHRRLPNNPLRPVLGGLLIEAGTDTVTLSGFDLETSTRAVLDADTLEPGASLVSGRLLADVAGALPAGMVDVVADDRECTVTAPGTTFTLPVMDLRDYPSLPEPPGVSGTVDGDRLAAAVTHAAQAAMTEKEAVGQLEGFGGVHVAADGDELVVSASDRYRIVRHRVPWTPGSDGDGSLLMPAAGIAVTAKQMAGQQVRLSFASPSGGVAALATDQLTVTSRTIAAAFPNIDGFFPKPEAAQGSAVFDSAELLAAVHRAGLVNDEESRAVRLSFDGGTVTVEGGHGGPSGRSSVDADTEGLDGFTAGYRPGFLASLLTPIDGQVRIWFTAPTKPVLIEPIDDDTYRAVCMPVRLT